MSLPCVPLSEPAETECQICFDSLHRSICTQYFYKHSDTCKHPVDYKCGKRILLESLVRKKTCRCPFCRQPYDQKITDFLKPRLQTCELYVDWLPTRGDSILHVLVYEISFEKDTAYDRIATKTIFNQAYTPDELTPQEEDISDPDTLLQENNAPDDLSTPQEEDIIDPDTSLQENTVTEGDSESEPNLQDKFRHVDTYFNSATTSSTRRRLMYKYDFIKNLINGLFDEIEP